jgi:lipopolysaccharide transport system ATP-binding protein
MRPIIKVEGLGKKYRLRRRRQADESNLREAFVHQLKRISRRSYRADGVLWALKDVSFDIYPGEVVGVIGRNGSGKSTLLKILSRITKPTTGTVDCYGRVGSLLEIGTGFHPDLTGRENIFLNGAILGMKRAEVARKFDEIVAFSEIEKFLDTPVKHYSSGMHLRLAFAVAAHLESEIILLDEVLAVGDAGFQKKCFAKMREIRRQGRTALFISHDMGAIEGLCGRVFLLEAGVMQEEQSRAAIRKYLGEIAVTESEEGNFDLSNHAARLPGCQNLIQRLMLYSPDGTPSSHFYPDDVMVAEIFIRPNAPLAAPRIALAIEDSTGRRITTVATYFQDQPLAELSTPSRIRCTLPPLRLGSGRYLISVSLSNERYEMIDGLDNAAWFDVGWRNNFGNDELYSPIYGPVLTPSTWERID